MNYKDEPIFIHLYKFNFTTGFGRKAGPRKYHYYIAAKSLADAEKKFNILLKKDKFELNNVEQLGEVVL